MKTVNEIAKMTGISRRAIRYYDEIGLLKPTEILGSGYRLYDDDAVDVFCYPIIYVDWMIVIMRKIYKIGE